jgi:outer membrane protein assembly factor BamB
MQMPTRIIYLVIIFVLTGLFLTAQTPTRWRGPNGDGVYPETGLLQQWPAAGPEIVWHFDGLGEGHSSPAFANNTIYLSGMSGKSGYIFALDYNGTLKWKAPYDEEFHQSYPGARSTPVVAGDLLYIYSGHGVLTCMDANTGAIKWKKGAFTDFDGKNITWGVTETVVVDGDLVYMTPGGKKNNVVALNRHNGNLVWSSPGKGEKSAYCTPLLVELPSRKLLVTHTGEHIIGLDAKDGRLLWSHPHTNRHQVHANTPVFSNGELFCFSGYGQGGVKLTLSADGSSVKKAWFNSNLDNRMGGMVVVDGFIYGSGDNNRQWRSVDWKTGEEKYVSTDIGKGVVIAADGMLYCYSERGELALVRATPDGFDIKGLTKVSLGSAQHWSHPVIHNDRLYLRHGNVLIAYKIK